MARNISSTLVDALTAPSVELFVAIELLFDSGPLRIWSGVGSKVIGGNTYTGTGSLLGVSSIDESDDLAAQGVTVSLTGIDSTLVSVALSEPYQNRVGKVFLGSGNSSFEVFTGFMDVMTISDSGDTCEISVLLESKLIVLDRIVPLRYTQETQQARYPGDTFFSYVAGLADKNIVWGRMDASQTFAARESLKRVIGG